MRAVSENWTAPASYAIDRYVELDGHDVEPDFAHVLREPPCTPPAISRV